MASIKRELMLRWAGVVSGCLNSARAEQRRKIEQAGWRWLPMCSRNCMEARLRTLSTASAILFLGCGVSFAQFAPSSPTGSAMGATSPLGVPGAASPVGPVGIPLGATALSPGGLSPAPYDPTASNLLCSGAIPSGLSSGAMGSSGSCGIATSTGSASGTSSLMGGGVANSAGSSGIPLGATELDNPGLSPFLTSPAPSSPDLMAAPPSSLSSSTMAAPGPINPTIRFGFSSAAGSGGLATGFTNFQPLGTSTAGGAGGLATGSTDRQTFGFSTGAGAGGRPTAPTVR